MNALNSALVAALANAVADAAADPAVRVIVFAGGGDQAFIAGADIGELHALAPDAALDYCRRLAAVGEALAQAPKPVVAAIGGWCLGGGLELALASDIRLASDGARFGLPEVTLAILPGAGGIARLSRLVGGGVALDLVLSGDIITADRALAIGLISRLVPAGQLADAADSLARRLAGFSPGALATIKQHMNHSAGLPLDQAVQADARACASLFGDDQKEAMAAFLDQRKADFSRKPAPPAAD